MKRGTSETDLYDTYRTCKANKERAEAVLHDADMKVRKAAADIRRWQHERVVRKAHEAMHAEDPYNAYSDHIDTLVNITKPTKMAVFDTGTQYIFPDMVVNVVLPKDWWVEKRGHIFKFSTESAHVTPMDMDDESKELATGLDKMVTFLHWLGNLQIEGNAPYVWFSRHDSATKRATARHLHPLGRIV